MQNSFVSKLNLELSSVPRVDNGKGDGKFTKWLKNMWRSNNRLTFENGVSLIVEKPLDPALMNLIQEINERKLDFLVTVGAESKLLYIQPATSSKVISIEENGVGDLELELEPECRLATLKQSHPDFDRLHDTLKDALEGEKAIVLETDFEYNVREIVSAAAANPQQLSSTAATMTPTATAVDASHAFQLVQANSCDLNKYPPSWCMPFIYPDNGCWARAHEMCRILEANGVPCEKIWYYGSGKNTLYVETQNTPKGKLNWTYHVAPVVKAEHNGTIQNMVIDPAMSNGPLASDDWKARQNDTSAKEHISPPEHYYVSKRSRTVTLDRDYVETAMHLLNYRYKLRERVIKKGPPPY